ncbi:protein-L-isoaspartate O-methyltransferase 1-like [Coffea arabica]|uniref:Protein-L-isoaspartate O-methyltransferase n=1 Tax=Coffea arabica TaxID=13443 RepID=A0A6P6X841_COFAR|nr:protein-L-isoaspartate O-methyltransferase 1-like [Coffea arabica]
MPAASSPSSLACYYSFSSVIACGCRYRAPLKHSFLAFTRRFHSLHPHHRYCRRLPPHSLAILAANTTAYSSRSRRLPKTHFFTGNSLFSRMERFWTGGGIDKNRAMVEHLQSYGVVRSKKVAEVMGTIDRALFVPDGTPPYVDTPMQIGYNATISAPHMHAMCLELLENHLQPGMHALDIGSGTGYLTACFAIMVGPQGHAVGVEHIPELAAESIKNIQKSAAAPLLKEGSLAIHAGDGRLGWPEHAPYDAIHVGAAAPEIPQALIDQLKPGGRMVIPVGNIFQDLKVVDKDMDGSISVHSETSVRYVPLTSREAQLRGY